MQLLDFALPVDFGIPADPRIKGAGRLLMQLLLPGVNLVRVDFVPLRQVRNRRLFPQRLQRNLRLQPRIDLPSRLFHHSLRLAYDGTARSQLPGRSQIQGPLHRRVPRPRHRPLAPRPRPAQSEGAPGVAANGEAGRRVSPQTADPSSLAECALCRQTPEVGAECPNWARSDLCGGRSAMNVPTAKCAGESGKE